MFIVIEGHATMRVAGEMLAVKAGDVAFVPPGPDYPHQRINTSDAPLKYLSISRREFPEVAEYPDSKKMQSCSPAFRPITRLDADLDDRDGEP